MNILTKSIITLTALASTGLHAEVFPIAEDTFGTIAKGTILKASGAAKSMTVSAKTKAYIGFDVGGSGIPASSVSNARLTVYVARATKTGNLYLANALGGFSETFTDKSIPMPADQILTTTALTDASSREYITFDVTNQVKSWLTTPSSEHGFVLAADGTLSLTIATKEGAGTGHPAILEVDVTPTQITGTSASFTGGVTTSGFFSTNGTNASFYVNAGFSPGGGATTLVAGFTGKNSNGPQLRFQEDGSGNFVDIGTDGSDNFVIENKFDAAMVTVTPAGNVGIGTTAPGARLEISNGTTSLQIRPGELNGVANASAITLEYPGSGTIGIWDSLEVAQRLIARSDYYGFGHVFLYAFEGEGNSGTAYLQARDNSGTSSIGLQLRTQNAGNIVDTMYLAPSGNVGVGTTTPSTRLGVAADAANAGVARFDNSNAAGFSGIYFDQAGTYRGNVGYVNSSSSFGAPGTMQLGAASDIVFSAQSGGFFSERMRIKVDTGNIGIGTASPGFKLDVNGGIRCIGAVNTTSDARYKINVSPLESALDKTLRLRGVSYDWNRTDFPAKGFDERHQIGFIAQEVRDILPDVVTADSDGYLSVGYSAIIPVLAEAVEELKAQKDAEIASLKAANAALKQQLAENDARDKALEARFARLEAAATIIPAVLKTAANTK